MNRKFSNVKTNAQKVAETEKKFEQHRLEAIAKREAEKGVQKNISFLEQCIVSKNAVITSRKGS